MLLYIRLKFGSDFLSIHSVRVTNFRFLNVFLFLNSVEASVLLGQVFVEASALVKQVTSRA